MVILYGIPNCDKVKSAIKWIKAHKIDFTFYNLKDGISAKKLESWVRALTLEVVINKKSTTYSNLSAEDKSEIKSRIGAIKLITAHTSIIKRPVIEMGDKIINGFNETDYNKFFTING